MSTLIPTAGVKTSVGPTILLASGHYFDFHDPEHSHFTIEDIAHALSMLCRFTGHVRNFYSVAEHSWHASYLVPRELARAALMHDAAEAFIGDVSRPLKMLLPSYRTLEMRIEAAIADRFGLGTDCADVSIKQADLHLLRSEQRAMMPPTGEDWSCYVGVPDLGEVTFAHWTPSEGKARFLDRWTELSR